MPSRVAQLMALLEEAKEKGDTDKVKEIESDLFKEKKSKRWRNRRIRSCIG